MPPTTPRASAYPETCTCTTHDFTTAIRELRECITIFDHALTKLHATTTRDLRQQASATAQRLSIMAAAVERHHLLNTSEGAR
jgi:hypothetical protein